MGSVCLTWSTFQKERFLGMNLLFIYEKWQNIARNIVFFSYYFEHTSNFVKDLYGRISRKIRQKVSLRLVLSHSRSVQAIFLQIFSINNLCGNRNLYFLFNLRAHVDNFVENTVSNDLCRILTVRKELKLP